NPEIFVHALPINRQSIRFSYARVVTSQTVLRRESRHIPFLAFLSLELLHFSLRNLPVLDVALNPLFSLFLAAGWICARLIRIGQARSRRRKGRKQICARRSLCPP